MEGRDKVPGGLVLHPSQTTTSAHFNSTATFSIFPVNSNGTSH